MKTFSFLLALGAGAAAIMGVGQAEPIDLGTIEVIANRSATADTKVGSTVNRVSQQEIKTRAQPSVADYLATLPGVSVSAPGGVGQETTLIVRGADKKYVKTLFNGIDISDVTATQVQPSIEHFMADGVSAIEVLKGSQGTLYGSDAVAGVIGISTLGEPEDGLHAELGAEGGSHSTFRSHAKVTAAGNGGKMALGVSGLNTAGISAAEEHAGNPERDGYKNFGLTFAGEQQMNDVLTLFGSALSISSTADYDDDGASPRDNPFNETSGTRQGARIGAKLNLLDGRVENIVSAQVFNTDRDIHSVSIFGPYDANFDGTRTKIDDQLTFTVNDSVKLLAGADHEWQSAAITDNYGTDFNARAENGGLWTEAIVTPLEGLSLTGSLRLDDHSQFGSHTTWRATAAHLFSSGTKLHGSLGTGFRAPSLYELYDAYAGNPGLKPEKSFSWDAGVGQTLMDGRLTLDVTVFGLDTDDLIDYSFATWSYVQVPGTTRRSGVELSAGWEANDWLTLNAAYTFTHTEQADGARRPRVPKHDLALSAVITPAEKWTIAATARYVNDTIDTGNMKLDNYFLLNARVAYQLTDNTQVYVRGENLLDQDYQVIKGYGTPDLSAYGGLTVNF